jgi:uncharacterized membrane protein
MKWYISTRTRLALALAFASLTSVLLFIVGALRNGSTVFDYLIWNLFLAWVPLVLMLWLSRVLRRKLWSSWQALTLTVMFVCFLPNTFYLVTDVIHLQETPRVDLVYDIIMFMSFILNGMLLGLTSVYLFHAELRKRLTMRKSWTLLLLLLLLTSFAIYIGRDLRWNSWDILLNPASILFEVSDRLLAPMAHPELFSTTLGFFALITSVYVVLWHAARALRQQKMTD